MNSLDYGCTLKELKAQVDSMMELEKLGPAEVSVKLLSNAQTLISLDKKDEASQIINRAKYVIHTYLMDDGE